MIDLVRNIKPISYTAPRDGLRRSKDGYMKNLGASPEVLRWIGNLWYSPPRAGERVLGSIPRSEDRFHNFFSGSEFNRGKPEASLLAGMDPRLPNQKSLNALFLAARS
jgi:hypothetical protein